MKTSYLMYLIVILTIPACKMKKTAMQPLAAADSFMPMQIGNKWSHGAHSYTEIQDTVRIGKQLYYKFYSLVGGDASDTKYLRIDENNQLLESYPDQPNVVYVHAKFNASLNDVFFTLNDKSTNDYQVKLVKKTPDRRTFEFDMVYHPNLKGSTHQVSYVKGIGLDDGWTSIKINGKIIK
ncbi:hypothetical protein HDF26_002817 [Pedobacter cryoconitis]|uniref:hypothetical protein n=1 Tax=Pedobacter cryoconitis TaxID=188932 RepID=UPI00160D220E|nr:hypothetical protein [Pedobacter cryoconitis]MBB6272360.1 hypothetical protein [Pedobacter cryoconitis]